MLVTSWSCPCALLGMASLQQGPEAEGQGMWSIEWAVTQNDH